MSLLLLFTGGGAAISAPLAGVDAEAFPAGLSSDTISAPLAGDDSAAFAAAFIFGQALSAPVAGSDPVVYPAALADSSNLLAPLAGVDAEAFPPSFPFDQTLTAPLAGVTAEAFPGVLTRDQFLLAPLAISGDWVFPAAVAANNVTVDDGVIVKSYSRAGALLAELDLAHGKQWTDQVDDTGSGSITVQNDDPDYAHTGFDRILRFFAGGQPRFASLVENRDVNSLATNGAEEITRLFGRGALALLEEGMVQPSRGVGALPIELERSFAWPSVDFDDSGWPLAKQMARQDQRARYWKSLPVGWPDPLAYWIWADWDDCTTEIAPPGPCLFRKTFTLAETTRVKIFATFDNAGDLYLDGAKLIDFDLWFSEGEYVTLTLDAGTHVIGLRGVNDPDDWPPGGNPGAVMCAVYSTTGEGFLDEVLVRTDSSWKCLPYPDPEPGFTLGKVLRILVEEAQAVGACDGVFLDFSDTLDSGGNPWPVEAEFTFTVGRSLLEVVQELAGSVADITMAPGGLYLRAWRIGERGTTKAVTLAAGSNLAGLSHNGKRTSVNSVLVRWDGGWLEEEDAASITAAGSRRSVFLDLSTVQSEEKARELARTTMDLRSSPRYATRAVLSPSSDAETATLHELEPGDTITHPNETLAPEAGRVRAITVEETEHGRCDRSLQLNDMAEELEARHDRQLRRMLPGSLAGGSRIVSPRGEPGPSSRQISAVQVAEFSFEGTVNTSSVVRLLLNGSYLGTSVTFTTDDLVVIPLAAQIVLANIDYLQIEVDGVLSQTRPASVSGNLIDFTVRRTAAADGTAGLDAQAHAI